MSYEKNTDHTYLRGAGEYKNGTGNRRPRQFLPRLLPDNTDSHRCQRPSALLRTAKYGPWLDNEVKPYIGLGVGYSLPAPQDKPGDNPGGPKAGAAGQAGLSYKLSKNAKVDLDYRYLYLSPDLMHGGNTTSPQLFGVRLGCDF